MRLDIDAAAADLWVAAAAGDHGPVQWRGRVTYRDALAIQLIHLDRKIEGGDRLVGWKVGLTSPRARRSLGADERPFGHILRSGLYETDDFVVASELSEPHIEPELCFVFVRPVDDPSQIADAIGSVHAAFEINENRPGTGFPDLPLLVADNLSHRALVVGEGAAARSLDLNAVAVEVACDGEVRFNGTSSEVLDDHLTSLARLVEALTPHGRRIEAGHRVITGSFCRLPVAAGERWTARFSDIGGVEIDLE